MFVNKYFAYEKCAYVKNGELRQRKTFGICDTFGKSALVYI